MIKIFTCVALLGLASCTITGGSTIGLGSNPSLSQSILAEAAEQEKRQHAAAARIGTIVRARNEFQRPRAESIERMLQPASGVRGLRCHEFYPDGIYMVDCTSTGRLDYVADRYGWHLPIISMPYTPEARNCGVAAPVFYDQYLPQLRCRTTTVTLVLQNSGRQQRHYHRHDYKRGHRH